MPEFQWLQPSFIDPRVRRIMKALSHADRALTNALERKLDVAGFVEPLKHLETFYFLSASRADPMLRPARSVASNRGETSQRQNQVALEMGELTEFARKVLPVVLAVTRGLKLRPSRGRWARVRDYYRVVTSQPIVRQAALLSGVAGVVMLVGTLVFRIRGDQAFLTWFTVTFGSLTVSVGITSVRLARGEIRETGKAKLT